MARIPEISPDDMNADQRRVYDDVMATTGRVAGPARGYIYSPRLWETTNAVSDHFADCALTQPQVKIVAMLTARHWNSKFPWTAQARQALDAGMDKAVVDAINARTRPGLPDAADAAAYDVASELLANGNVSDETFKRAGDVLGYPGLVDAVGAVGHFCKVCMMASAAGAEAPADAPSVLMD